MHLSRAGPRFSRVIPAAVRSKETDTSSIEGRQLDVNRWSRAPIHSTDAFVVIRLRRFQRPIAWHRHLMNSNERPTAVIGGTFFFHLFRRTSEGHVRAAVNLNKTKSDATTGGPATTSLTNIIQRPVRDNLERPKLKDFEEQSPCRREKGRKHVRRWRKKSKEESESGHLAASAPCKENGYQNVQLDSVIRRLDIYKFLLWDARVCCLSVCVVRLTAAAHERLVPVAFDTLLLFTCSSSASTSLCCGREIERTAKVQDT